MGEAKLGHREGWEGRYQGREEAERMFEDAHSVSLDKSLSFVSR
jgi:hypothetical protein